MARNTIQLSRLMRISWQIQKRKHVTRSKSLIAAWIILKFEDITVEHLTQKLNHHKPIPQKALGQFALFTH